MSEQTYAVKIITLNLDPSVDSLATREQDS